MAYSSGFNPHPRISYAGAAPTGSASEAEYLEIALAQVVDPADVHAALDEALPDGLDVLDVVVSGGGSLSDRLEASRWQIVLTDVPLADAEAAVEAFRVQEEVTVERMTKKGLRTFNCRAAVVALAAGAAEQGSMLDVVIRQGTPSVRPDDVLAGLKAAGGLQVGAPPLQRRLAQGPWDEATGHVGDPLIDDRG